MDHSELTTSTPPARTVTVHVVTSLSPDHVPAQYHFTDSIAARTFASAVARASNVYRIHATNAGGVRLIGFGYMGAAERRRREAESVNPTA